MRLCDYKSALNVSCGGPHVHQVPIRHNSISNLVYESINGAGGLEPSQKSVSRIYLSLRLLNQSAIILGIIWKRIIRTLGDVLIGIMTSPFFCLYNHKSP
jgi:hypothetical protein